MQYCLLLQDFKLKLHVLNESPRVVYHEELVFIALYRSLSDVVKATVIHRQSKSSDRSAKLHERVKPHFSVFFFRLSVDLDVA